jgi:hypothetical protein
MESMTVMSEEHVASLKDVMVRLKDHMKDEEPSRATLNAGY